MKGKSDQMALPVEEQRAMLEQRRDMLLRQAFDAEITVDVVRAQRSVTGFVTMPNGERMPIEKYLKSMEMTATNARLGAARLSTRLARLPKPAAPQQPPPPSGAPHAR